MLPCINKKNKRFFKFISCCGMMCDLSRVFSVICALSLFSVSYCYNGTCSNRRISKCLQHYYRNLKSGVEPPRTYQYYHETLAPNQVKDDYGEDGYLLDVDVQFRIVGGSHVSIHESPYQVLYGRTCGGTIIAPEWVLTAAHCNEDKQFVLAGSTRRTQTTQYPICAHFTHPFWGKSHLNYFDYDYQLVLLEIPIPVTLTSRPIAIGSVQDIQEGAIMTVTGWGQTDFNLPGMHDILRRVRVPIMSLAQCRSLPLGSYRNVTDRMFCAGFINGDKDSCMGDSGGPAVLNGKLIGLVSHGVGCAMRFQPGVYSNVPLAREWICAVTGLTL